MGNVINLVKSVVGKTESVKLSKDIFNKLQKKLLDTETYNNFRSKINLAGDVCVKTAKKGGKDPEPMAAKILRPLKERFDSVIYRFRNHAKTDFQILLTRGELNEMVQNLQKRVQQGLKSGKILSSKDLNLDVKNVGEPIRSLQSDLEAGKKLLKMTY